MDTQKLIQFYIKEKLENNKLTDIENKEKNNLLEICNDFVDKIKNKCSLLYNLRIFEIKEKSSGLLSIFTLFILPCFLVSIFLPFMFSYVFIYVINYFEESTPFIAIRFGFGINDLHQNGLYKYLISFFEQKINIKLEKDNKSNKNDNKKLMEHKEEKMTIKGEQNEQEEKKIFNENEKKMNAIIEATNCFFEQILLYIGPIQIIIKAKELSKEIFDFFENLKNKKENEWNFLIEEIL